MAVDIIMKFAGLQEMEIYVKLMKREPETVIG